MQPTDSRHALRHLLCVQLHLEKFARILESTIAVKKWVRIGVFQHCRVERVKNKLVVIAGTHAVGNDACEVAAEDIGGGNFRRCPHTKLLSIRKNRAS